MAPKEKGYAMIAAAYASESLYHHLILPEAMDGYKSILNFYITLLPSEAERQEVALFLVLPLLWSNAVFCRVVI